MATETFQAAVAPRIPSQLTDAVYREHVTFLRRLAWKKYKVPDDIAENIAHDALLCLARKEETIVDVRAWLCTAVYYACQQYWRGEARFEALPASIVTLVDERSEDLAERLAITMAVAQAFERLDARCREVIHLRFYDEKTSREMAEDLGTTAKYAEKLLYGSLDKLRRIYKKLTRVRR